ncbi:BAG family molecular chaperone regulator 3-like [Watersipora subatra]|uniref:BAG family molecular chaperone regulator 3-like n=1 Tax=Watersipora subatra TaxID=2589382 RepID=UPI00355B8C94
MTTKFEETDGESSALPRHWEMRMDDRTGMPYYLNHLKQFTTWDDPRIVEEPRGMLNNMGSMVRERQRSISPQPSTFFRKANGDGSTTIPFNHHFFASSDPGFSQSLPRQRRNNRRTEDNQFQRKFDHQDDDFFNDDPWSIKFPTLRGRSQSPSFGCHPRQGSVMQQRASQPSINIPINTEHDRNEIGVKEHIIEPSQYKQATDKGQIEKKGKSSDSPVPKLAKQEGEKEATKSEDKEESRAHDTNSDNSDPGLVPKPKQTIDINDNQELEESPEKSAEQPNVTQENEDLKDLDQTEDAVDSKEEELNDLTEETQEGSTEDVDADTGLEKRIDISYKAIERVCEKIAGYTQEVDEFTGDKNSKQFRYLEEMLTRCQLELDDIETHGNLELRKRRKETVNSIESLLKTLESRCKQFS